MSRTVHFCALIALQLTGVVSVRAQTVTQEVSVGVAPILAFAVAEGPIVTTGGAPTSLPYAYTTNLQTPRLVMVLDGTLPAGITVWAALEESGLRAALLPGRDRTAAAALPLPGRSAVSRLLHIWVEGEPGIDDLEARLTLILTDDETGIERVHSRPIILRSALVD